MAKVALKIIDEIVRRTIIKFANDFFTRHECEFKDPKGTINMKKNNVFISKLGNEIQFFSSLARSFDSSFGCMIEKLAVNIAENRGFKVDKEVKGALSSDQTNFIANLLEKYKNGQKPAVSDYNELKNFPNNGITKKHNSDYCLFHEKSKKHYLIELKIGGDLDNKKARSEKEAILEQYAILSNSSPNVNIQCFFATAYNLFGDDNDWNQKRVKQYFADDELLIGEKFWNFIYQSKRGYNLLISSYNKHAHHISEALTKVKELYLQMKT